MKKQTRYFVAYKVEEVLKTRRFRTLKRLKSWARSIRGVEITVWKEQHTKKMDSTEKVYRVPCKATGEGGLNKIKL